MTRQAEQGMLGLADLKLPIDADLVQIAQQRSRPLFKEGFRGVCLDAPRSIDLTAAEELPCALFVAAGNERMGELDQSLRAALVTVGPDAETVRVGRFGFEEAPMSGEDDAEDDGAPPPRGSFAETQVEDVARCNDLPWRPGTVFTTLLLWDVRSNTLATELRHPSLRDPEVAAWLEAQRTEAFPPPVTPAGQPLPSWRAAEGSPKPPAEAGIVLAEPQPRVFESSGPPCVLRGAFRARLRQHHLVRTPADAASAPGYAPVGDAEAKTVVPLTIVAVGSGPRSTGPFTMEFQIPTYGRTARVGDHFEADGFFNLDLRALPRQKKRPQTFVIWALCGTLISNPVQVRFQPKVTP